MEDFVGENWELNSYFLLLAIPKLIVKQKWLIELWVKMLRCLIFGNPRVWENLLPHIEFAYNRVVNSTTSHTPFEVVYGFNPLTPLDLLPILVLGEVLCKDGFEKASFIKDLHHHIKLQIERKIGKYPEHANKGHKALIFEPGDWVWLTCGRIDSLLIGSPNLCHVVLFRSSRGIVTMPMSLICLIRT